LVAHGLTLFHRVSHIYWGYSRIAVRLSGRGARLDREAGVGEAQPA
jgi:UDP-N-acetylglucosamine enolpyruvyl transferase